MKRKQQLLWMKTLDPRNPGHTVSAGINAVVTMESNLLSDACAAVYSHDSLLTTYETEVLRRVVESKEKDGRDE